MSRLGRYKNSKIIDEGLRWAGPWLAVFVITFVPFLFISRLDSMIHGLTAIGFVTDLSVLIVIAGFTAIAFGAAAWTLNFVLSRAFGFRRLGDVNILAASSLLALVALQYALIWGRQFTSLDTDTPIYSPWKVALVVALIFLFRNAALARWKVMSARTGRFALLVFLVAAVEVAVRAASSQVPPPTSAIAPESKIRPNIILISFDAMRADELGTYGYSRKASPNIDEFAKTSTTISNMMASSNSTSPAIASLFTGRPAVQTGVVNIFRPLRRELVPNNLAAMLRKVGYETFASVGNPVASPNWLHIQDDFTRIFDGEQGGNIFNWVMGHSARIGSYAPIWITLAELDLMSGSGTKHTTARSSGANLVFANAFDLVAKQRTPFFLWVHAFQPHDPYDPPVPYHGRFLRDRPDVQSARLPFRARRSTRRSGLIEAMRDAYDENLFYADAEFGKFLTQLKSADLFDRSLVIVTGDHGESFGKAGFTGHGHTGLYQDVVRVPLLVKLPNQRARGAISANAQTTDLFPTIINLIGESAPSFQNEPFAGRSLTPILMSHRGEKSEPWPKYSASVDLKTKALVWGQYKIIRGAGAPELYDLNQDPTENKNLMKEDPVQAQKILNDAKSIVSAYLGEI